MLTFPLSTPRNFDDFIPFEIQKSFIHTCPSSSPQLPPTNPRPPLDPPPPVRRVTGQPSIGFFLSSITRCTRDKTPFLHSVPPFSRLCHYAASRLPRRIPRKRKLIVAEEEETARLVTVLLQPDRKGRRGPR